jgi:hypothetical protein
VGGVDFYLSDGRVLKFNEPVEGKPASPKDEWVYEAEEGTCITGLQYSNRAGPFCRITCTALA